MKLEYFVALAGMAIISYFLRVGGIWLTRRIKPSKRMKLLLQYIPGCVLVSIVIPASIKYGFAGTIAAAVSIVTMVFTRSLLLATLTGMILFSLFRG